MGYQKHGENEARHKGLTVSKSGGKTPLRENEKHRRISDSENILSNLLGGRRVKNP